MTEKGIRRREVLKGAVVGVGVAALAGFDSKVANASKPPAKWDKEADVVVVGSGTGLVGALAAGVAGNKVIVLEKMAVPGGSTGISAGGVWVPNNSCMRAADIPDSRENTLTYLRLIAQGQADEELITAFADNGPRMADFVAANSPIVWEILPGVMCSEYHPEWPGAVKRGRTIMPVTKDPVEWRGPILVRGLLDGCKRKGVEFQMETAAKRLIARMLSDGRLEVLGVIAERGGKMLNIKANKGVILAAGGYDWNFEMKRHFLRGPTPYATGVPSLTGDGILMAMAVGADLRNMNECWGHPVYKEEAEAKNQKKQPAPLTPQIERGKPGAIMVNRYGERFCNEASDYNSMWRSFFARENWGDLRYRNLPAYLIMDHKCRTKYSMAGRAADEPLPAWVKQANTLEELSRTLDIDAERFVKTVSEFNDRAQMGKDPLFHRGESFFDQKIFLIPDPTIEGSGATLAPLETPPFYGAEVAQGDLGTCGGPRVNTNAQVLDPFGQVIPRLYACGNNSGVGGPGAGYGAGGGTLGPAMTFAYLAGNHAVTLKAWK